MTPDEWDQGIAQENNPTDNRLEAVVKRYLGVSMAKAQTKLGGSDWSRKNLSVEHYAYMAEDVALLPRLWEVLQEELIKAGLVEVFRKRMEFFPHLNQIKMTGVPNDITQHAQDRERVQAEKEEAREQCRKIFADYRHPLPKSRRPKVKVQVEGGKFRKIPQEGTEEFSPSNPHHILGALAAHGIELEDNREITLVRADRPETRALLQFRRAKKWLDEMDGISRATFPDARVRAAGWNQLAAVTGRIISTEPNLQQIRADWRGGYRPLDPFLWLKGDLEQIEMLAIAVVTGDTNLIALLKAGLDVYVVYGAQIFGRKAERGIDKDQITDSLRSVAKIPTLGTSYGLTPFGFIRQIREQLGIEYTFEEAQGFFDTFFEMFPGIRVYHEKAAELALSNLDHVRTAGGSRRLLPPLVDDQIGDYWPSFEKRKKIIINTPIQGGCADLVIWAVNQFVPELPAGVEIVNLVHDEVDALVTPETLTQTVKVIRRAFENAFAQFYGDVLIPKIKFSSGPSWGETAVIP